MSDWAKKRALTQSVVELIDVHASRGANEVLHGVSMSVGGGELVALRGDSGGGKTSVLMTCAGLLRPTSGRLIVRGE